MPNAKSYPWQWLWDSCFHAIAWSGLGDDRAVTELESLFALQLPSGFLPHMGYQTRPEASLRYWSEPGRSDITQPPMYGHALRILAARGYSVDHLYDRATRALEYVFTHRFHADSGLVRVVHPWETGCDDSPRWDGLRSPGHPVPEWDERKRWYATKVALVRSLEKREGAAITNPRFDVCSIGFAALVAFNTYELTALTRDASLHAKADRLADAIDRQWVAASRTWADFWVAGPSAGATIRTLDSLLPVLITKQARRMDEVFDQMFSNAAFWRPYGLAGTAVDEPSYDPATYWRGPVWPQLTYLVMIAALHAKRTRDALAAADSLVRGCETSGFAEYWDPETGKGRGAKPQGWAALAWEGILLRRTLSA